MLATLVVAAVGVHLPALGAGFLADDYVLLRTLDRVDGVPGAFTHNDLGEDEGHFYRPLWVTAHEGVRALFGDRPAAFHAFDLLLFAVVTLEVWLLARRLLDPGGATAAAALFAVYPRHGESVAWISGSTDLLAVALGLAALLAALRARGGPIAAAGAIAAAAALAKEAAFTLPALTALTLFAVGRRGRELVVAPLAMLGAQAAVVALRVAVLGGVGGYGDHAWTPLRVAAASASYAAAAFTPPQLDVLRHPVLLVVPGAVAAALAWSVVVARGERRRAAAFGLGWVVLALLPSLNLIVDLNTANGERLLFLPSVGLCVAVGAVLPLHRQGATLASAALVAVLAALSLFASVSWLRAGRIADRVVREAAALGRGRGELLLLSVPESYRNARVLGVGLDVAVGREPSAARRTAWCAPVQVLDERAGSVRFHRETGTIAGRSTWSAPFTFPFRRRADRLTPDCAYRATGDVTLGRGLAVAVIPAPRERPVVFAYFDGERLRVLRRRSP